MINWSEESFHPIVNLPDEYKILDLTKGNWESKGSDFSIGKYDELRPNMYTTQLFKNIRNVHVGVDIGGPIGTPCMAFMDGKIHNFGYNPKAGDYGNVVITEHKIGGKKFWALYGHLDSKSIRGKIQGHFFEKGEILGHFGSEEENGGWDPHLHFQLSLVEPETHDLPGVVSKEERKSALEKYPDPRLVLGPIY
jgi:murein DD-endopeptidase MepM/ murein hydrolase activator NlpD|tara:strand:- start:5082 stop:5663 length:582 start_codon:yes stop_codon:yes gene_type:complete